MSRRIDWLKEQMDEGLEIYIYTREKYTNDITEHIIIPQVNIEGLCVQPRECDFKRTMDLNSFDALGNKNDANFLASLAKSLELDKYIYFMQYATELRNGDELRTALADSSVLALKKIAGKFYSSVINLDVNATEVTYWDVKNGQQVRKIHSRSLPRVRQGCATGDTIEEAFVKSALIYNTEKNLEHIEHFKNALKTMESENFGSEHPHDYITDDEDNMC